MKSNQEFMFGRAHEQSMIAFGRQTFGQDFISCIQSDKDLYEGTDAILWGLRIDFTLNFESKNNTVLLGQKCFSNAFDVQYGYRTGNGVVQFEEPVLVIGIKDTQNLLAFNAQWAVEAFVSQFKSLVTHGIDLYWDYVDSLELA